MPTDAWNFDYGSPYGDARNAYVKKLIGKGCSERKAWSVAFRKYPW